MKWTMILALIFSIVSASPAQAKPTEEEKCQTKKLQAVGKRDFCYRKQRARLVLGKTEDLAKCRAKFAKSITKIDERAAKKLSACRWLDEGDGTVIDLNTGLQWELKTDDGTVHDKDNIYVWNDALTVPDAPDGTVFTEFLWALNRGSTSLQAVGALDFSTTGCLGNKCDWRIPTIEELTSIIEPTFGTGVCVTLPCTTIPGETQEVPHVTITESSPTLIFIVDFSGALVRDEDKDDFLGYAVRGVRGSL